MISKSRAREWRLVIPGRAYSLRSPAAAEYKAQIARIAREVFPEPLKCPVNVSLDYFHRGNRRMDMDNVSKCVLDALNEVGYLDDRQVEAQSSREHDLRNVVRLSDAVDVIKPLRDHSEYVLVRMREVKTE